MLKESEAWLGGGGPPLCLGGRRSDTDVMCSGGELGNGSLFISHGLIL